MKRLLLVLFCGWMLSGVTNATEIEVTIDNLIYTLNTDDQTAIVKGYDKGLKENLVIPPLLRRDKTYEVTEIEERAFYSCGRLNTVYLPSTLKRIGEIAFYNCFNLESVDIASDAALQEVGNSAFYNCSKLTTVNFPSTLQDINGWAFYNCSNLTTVNLPSNSILEAIGNSAFEGCSSLKTFNFSSTLQLLGINAFRNCFNLTTVNFPPNSTLQRIRESAFYKCLSLTTVYLPSTLQYIDNFVFAHCVSLTTVYLPSTLQYIDDGAFASCLRLELIYCAAQTPSILVGPDVFYRIGDEDGAILYVPTGCKPVYEQADGWNNSFKEIREFDFSTNIESTTYSGKEDLIFANGQLSLPASYSGLAEINVYTTAGSLVGTYFLVSGSACDLSALARGIYPVEVKVDGKVLRTKIAK